VKDQFWDEQYPELPYTVATEENRNNAHPELGSTALIEVRKFLSSKNKYKQCSEKN